MTSIWATALVLGGLIFVHELGHFLLARWAGVEVKVFSLGFGPKIFGFTRGETLYKISAVPLGGYVKMLGEHPDDETPPDKMNVSFAHKPVGKRLAIVAAGPLANLFTAVIIFGIVLLSYGRPVLLPQIGEVLKGYPAIEAGLKAGDMILGLDDREIDNWSQVSAYVAAQGAKPINVTVDRSGKVMTLVMTPRMGQTENLFGEPLSKPMIGIAPTGKTKIVPVGFTEALWGGFVQAYDVAELTLVTLQKLILAKIPLNSVGGPIFIAQAAGEQAEAGWVNLFFFMGLLSVNLAMINLLPIPVLDGGHLFFFSLEAIFRRPVSLRIRERAQQAGLVLILAFFAVIFYNDIIRLFGIGSGGVQ